MNPILPRKCFTPDAEARVMPDGRLYLYGSNDISGHDDYCSKEYYVYSTADKTLTDWTEHGLSFSNTKDGAGLPWNPDINIYAPDAIHHNGKYYLYICGEDGSEAVAVADKPSGPFANAQKMNARGIDPAIFVDDDGQAYYLWGQFSLKGAKLEKDMATVIPDSVIDGILTEQEHGFHEGSSLRKINGKYYLVYTDITNGSATCLAYAVADKPLGPYKKGGIIIDNIYCDPKTWNNHGSIEEYKGQLYVFYHRSSQNSRYSRRVCAEPIFINADGSINQVEMTSNGASAPIDAFGEIDASIACRLKGNAYIAPDNNNPGKEILTNCGGGNWTQDWAEYRYLDFADGAAGCTLKIKGKGKVSIMAQGMGVLGESAVNAENEFSLCPIILNQKITGKKAIWIFFDGKEMELDTFAFNK